MFNLIYKMADIFKYPILKKIVKTIIFPQKQSMFVFNAGTISLVIILGIIIICCIYSKKTIPYIKKMSSSVKKGVYSVFTNNKVQTITDIYKVDKAISAAGYAYDEKQDIFYSKMNAWQRQMGYCRLYDEAASPFGMVIDSEPIFFEYNNKKWLIEFWKGQYDMTCGAEVGVYTSKKKDVEISGVFEGTFYDCANHADMLNMKFILKKNGKILFEREGRHWWLTGFRLGEFAQPDELTMDIEITLKDKIMLNAFLSGLKDTGYDKNSVKIISDTVYINYAEPKTKQPSTRTKRTDEMLLNNSELLCTAYSKITEPYDTMPQKAAALRDNAPYVYKHIVNIGKRKQIFWNHDIISDYTWGDLKTNNMTELDSVYNTATRIPIDDSSKIVIMSDCHRGDGSKSDDFAKNNKLYYSALKKYYKDEFTYIELGDGEELWENRNIEKIIKEYKSIYLLFKKFYKKDRLYFVFGNHDKEKQSNKYAQNYLYRYYDAEDGEYKDLFKGIKTYEALVLEHRETKGNVFLLHGHQVDFFNNKLWFVARFLLRYLWKPLEHLGIQDPTRTAKVYKKKLAVERKLMKWITINKHMVIAGHTHKPVFSSADMPPYFNDGSCVSKKGITAIEIENGMISLVKWRYKKDKDNKKILDKDIMAGPTKVSKYFSKTLVE